MSHNYFRLCVHFVNDCALKFFYFNLFFRRADEALLAHIGGPRHPRLDWNRWRTHRVRSGGHNNSTQPIESYKISTFSWASLPRLSGSNRRRCFGSDAWRVVSRLNTVRCVAAAIHGHLFGLHLSELCLPFKFGQDQRRNRPAQLWAGTYRTSTFDSGIDFLLCVSGSTCAIGFVEHNYWQDSSSRSAVVGKTDQPVLSPATLFLIFAFAQGLARVQSGKFVPSLSRLNI